MTNSGKEKGVADVLAHGDAKLFDLAEKAIEFLKNYRNPHSNFEPFVNASYS